MVNNVNFITWIVIKSRTNFALTAPGGGGSYRTARQSCDNV